MSKLDDLLAQYESPSAAGDDQVSVTPVDKPPSATRASSKLDGLLSQYGAEPNAAAPEQNPQIYKQNPFVSTVKSTTAGIANALAGQPLEDIGEAVGSKTLQEAGRSVRERMESVQQENPSEIGSLEDIVKKPGAAVQTALGNLAPQIPLSMGGAYAGAKAGAMLPVPPQLKPITAAGGGILGAFAPNYFQEAAEMRGKQHETGAEDKSKAYLTAIPAAGLETASDVLIAGKFLPKAVKQSAIGEAVGKFAGEGLSETGSRLAHVGKQAAKGVLGEGATEYAQTALEQVGGGQDLNTEESQREREVSAALGAIGGGLVSGGLSAFDKRVSEQQPDTEQAETSPQEPPPAAAETQDVDNIPVSEDFAEVPTGTAQEPIIVPPESEQTSQDVYEAAAEADAFAENAKFNRLNDFVTQYQAKLDLGGIPTMVGKHLREAATAAGTYDPKDRPDVVFEKLKAAVAAMKSPEQKIEEAGQQARESVKSSIEAQYDGKPMGVVGRAATTAVDQGLSPEEQVAKEQKAAELEAEQQSVVDTDTGEVLTETPVTPTLDELVADYLQFPVETLQRQANLSTLTPEQREAIRIAKEQKIAEKEAQDALSQQETGALYGGDSEQPGLLGEGERATESGAGVPPEGQTDRNIPTTEEIITEPTIGEANGEGSYETTQTTSQEVTPEHALREIGRLSDEVMGGNHPAMPQQSLANGDFAGSGKLNMDSDGNVVLTRVASSEDHLSKDWQDISGEELINTSLSHGGGRGIPTSGISSWGKSYGKAHGGDRVIGTFKIPLQDLLSAIQNGNAILGNVGEGEIVLNPAFAETYLTSVTDTEGNPIARKQDGITLPSDITGRAEAAPQEVTEAPIDRVAAQTEASKAKVSDAKEQEGEYPKASLVISGIPVSIENSGVTKYHPAGSVREGVDESGKEWSVMLKDHYGEIRGTEAADGDAVDVFIVPGTTDVNKVFIVDQMKVGPDGKQKGFDEHKIIFGAKNLAEAKDVYSRNYSEDWNGLGAISVMPLDKFKQEWLTSDEAMKSPYSKKAADADAAYKESRAKIDSGPFHPAVVSLANDLTVGGGMGPLMDDRGKVVSRLKSTNPEWFKDGAFSLTGPSGGTIKPSVAKIQEAVSAYEKGAELDFVQAAILRRLSDIAESMEAESKAEVERAAEVEEQDFQDRLTRIRESARAELSKDLAASWENSIDSGAISKDNIGDYEADLADDIAQRKQELENEKDTAELEEIDNIPSPLGDTPNLKHEENKDIDTVKSKFRDAVQKAYEEGDLDIPQYMVALDMMSSKDTEVLKGIQKFIDNLMPGYGELQRVKAKGSVNVKRLLALVGSSMYKANLADTSIKEMVQNSFDAVKEQIAKNKTLKGQGKIDVLVDSSNRLIAIRDNGVGMTKKTILDAFLTVAGSNKEGLEAGDASGGFGMAKAAFLYGNEKIYLRTVHNGKLSTLEATGAELLDKGVDLATVPTDEPNGTTIIVKVPENVTINGEERYVYFPYGHKSIEFFQKPLLNDDVTISYNNNYVDLQELVNGNADEGLSVNDVFDAAMFGGEVVPTGKNMDMSGYDKATTASFDWGSADIFIGKKRNKYPAHQILSAGVYQFDDSINLRGWDKVPYDILINVKPTVSADSANYPFNLKREGWKDLVEKDIGAMKAYIKQVAMGIEAQETVDVFKNIKAMPTIEVDDIGGETTFNVSDFIPKKEVAAAAPSEVFTPPSVSISVGKVTGVDAKGETVTYVDVEAEKAKEKGQEASFKADKEAPTAKDFLLDFGIDPESPVYVNNTSFDFVENDPNIAVFFAELGNILMQAKRKVESLGLYGYKKLSDTPTFMGVSIDKQYHGVHVNVPFHGIFLNPLAVKGTKLPGIVAGLWETMVHEFTHIPEGNHDESFVMEYHNLSSKLAEDGFDIRMRVLLSKTLKKHKDSFLAARENYEASTTKNIARSLHEGEDGTGVTSRRTETTRQGGIEGATTDATSALQKQRENQSGEGFQRDADGDIAAQFSRRAPMTQMDLFADSPGELTALQTKQQVAAYAAQKDKKRQGNGAEPPPLFSDYPGFMGQTDIEDTQASLEDTFKALGKFDKAPETINHPDAERIRYVQDNFLDLLTELESNNKVEIKC